MKDKTWDCKGCGKVMGDEDRVHAIARLPKGKYGITYWCDDCYPGPKEKEPQPDHERELEAKAIKEESKKKVDCLQCIYWTICK